jgi:2-succinyl-6-hydroxy-2,4-cyclohexadiene-1-carboxylate synthase
VPADRLVLVHGFTQTARSWDPIRARLARAAPGLDAVALDASGHGAAASVRADPWRAAELLVDAGGAATYAGYSMGARLCLHAALARPGEVRRLVLVSGTAGIADPAERAARRRADDELAATIEAIGVDAFLERWLAQPLFASLPADARQLADRRRNTADGLAASLRLAGAGAQESLWDRLGEVTMPALIVVGEHDAKFVAVAERMGAMIGRRAEVVVIASAGHTVHLERPDAFVDVLTAWLRHSVEGGARDDAGSAAPRQADGGEGAVGEL